MNCSRSCVRWWQQGKSIIFITHKLREVMDFADRITVIRRGKVVGSTHAGRSRPEQAGGDDGGPAVELEVDKDACKPGEIVLQVEDLVVLDERHQVAVDGISFEVRAGEVLGIAGVQGNGQTELVEAVTGLRSRVAGNMHLLGNDITHATPRKITEHGRGARP